MTSQEKEIFSLFKKRDENANKGDFGRALLICGSYGMAGAAAIAAKAIIKSGIGICDIACEDRVYPIISPQIPEAVCTPINKSFDETDKKALKNSLNRADVVVIGCGMGNTDYTDRILRFILEYCTVPLIIDADALNVLSGDIDLLLSKKCEVIVTPHPGEMSRLIGKTITEINADRIETATAFSKKYDVVTLLKGKGTVISDKSGEYVVNESGSVAMATGGSGDMLCGIIAALLGEGFSCFDAARAGAYIHGLCGEDSAEKYSVRSTSASTMLRILPQIFKKIEKGD